MKMFMGLRPLNTFLAVSPVLVHTPVNCLNFFPMKETKILFTKKFFYGLPEYQGPAENQSSEGSCSAYYIVLRTHMYILYILGLIVSIIENTKDSIFHGCPQ